MKKLLLLALTSISLYLHRTGVIKRFNLNSLNNDRNNHNNNNNKYENRLRSPPTTHVHPSLYDSRNRIDIMVKCERARPLKYHVPRYNNNNDENGTILIS